MFKTNIIKKIDSKLFNYNRAWFEEDNFFTIIRRPSGKMKIIYGNFLNDNTNRFVYKGVIGKNDMEDFTTSSRQNKCDLSKLVKPNENELCFKFHNYCDALKTLLELEEIEKHI